MALNLSSASLCYIASSATPQFLILKNKIYPSSSCKLFAQAESREGGVTEQGPPRPPSESLSSTRTQLDLLEQLTSTSDGMYMMMNALSSFLTHPHLTDTSSDSMLVYESSGSSSILTIRDQLVELGRGRDDDFSIPLGKNLKKVSPRFLTVSQKRNIKRQAYLDDVSQRNDSVFFATIGAFVILPPFIILGIAIITGYVQLFP